MTEFDSSEIITNTIIGKTAEYPTTIFIQGWFKNYELKSGFGGLPPIIMLICINLVEYNI